MSLSHTADFVSPFYPNVERSDSSASIIQTESVKSLGNMPDKRIISSKALAVMIMGGVITTGSTNGFASLLESPLSGPAPYLETAELEAQIKDATPLLDQHLNRVFESTVVDEAIKRHVTEFCALVCKDFELRAVVKTPDNSIAMKLRGHGLDATADFYPDGDVVLLVTRGKEKHIFEFDAQETEEINRTISGLAVG